MQTPTVISNDTDIIRITGLTAWYLLVATVTVGVTSVGNLARQSVRANNQMRIHRILGRFFYGALALHVYTILNGKFRGWSLQDVTQIGWGTVARNCAVTAMYLTIVVALSQSFKRSRPRQWKMVHRSVPFAIVILATIHGVLAGPDRNLWIYLPAVSALTVLGMIFLIRSYESHARSAVKGTEGQLVGSPTHRYRPAHTRTRLSQKEKR